MITALVLSATGGFDVDSFERFMEVRMGTGKPVFWYCTGELYSYPEGKLVAKVEGVDTARRWRSTRGESAEQLNRKVFFYRDVTTGQVRKDIPRIEYDYQYIKYRLDGHDLVATVEQGKGARKQTISARGGNVKRVGKTRFFSVPLFLSIETPRGKVEAYENYEFIDSGTPLYRLTWNRFGDLPPAFGAGKAAMHLVAERFDDYRKLPESLRAYLETEAPLWKLPPRDLAEVEALQK